MTSVATTSEREPRSKTGKLYCQLDDWEFDSRYTDGACPICGWRPATDGAGEGGATVALRRIPWDLVMLGVLALVLLILAVAAGMAAHISLMPR